MLFSIVHHSFLIHFDSPCYLSLWFYRIHDCFDNRFWTSVTQGPRPELSIFASILFCPDSVLVVQVLITILKWNSRSEISMRSEQSCVVLYWFARNERCYPKSLTCVCRHWKLMEQTGVHCVQQRVAYQLVLSKNSEVYWGLRNCQLKPVVLSDANLISFTVLYVLSDNLNLRRSRCAILRRRKI